MKRPLLAFFALTYVFSWSCFLSGRAVAGSRSMATPGGTPVVSVLFLLGAIMPSLVATALTAYASGRAGIVALFRGVVQPAAGAGWYVFAATWFAALKLTAAVLHRAVFGIWPAFGTEPIVLLIVATLFSTPVQAGEELGWRAYALPRLAARVGLGPASLLLGVVWATWHLPLFFVPNADTYHQSFPLYLIQVVGLSVVMAWLYWRVKGSLLPVMLLHAAVNNTKDIVPSAVENSAGTFAWSTSRLAWIAAVVLWICAAYCLAAMRGRRLRTSSA